MSTTATTDILYKQLRIVNNNRKGGERVANEQIRKAITESGFRQWEVAEFLGINESSFSRKLRHELPKEEAISVLAAIDRQKEGRPHEHKRN